MAVISNDTFNSLRRYIGVRLQQGVPIVDADWNEMEDVRKFELRAFLKWFVGNGIPEGNDGFRISGSGLANDFTVLAGILGPPDGLGNVGRCLVDGVEAIITANIGYRAQTLHVSQPGSAALAATLGVPTIPEVPNLTGTVTVFIDVWDRLVTPTEDPSLVHPGLGTESCARIRREWVVRTRSGTSLPVSGDGDFRVGHVYYALASIARQVGVPVINQSGITDLRERRLVMLPSTLVTDLFGTSLIEYRRGRNRPPLSYREVLNAIIRGEVPGTPEAAIAPAPASADLIGRGTFFDATGGLITVWASDRVGTRQVIASRLDLNNINAGFFTPPQQITAGPIEHIRPHATLLNNGDVIVVYESQTAPGNEDIHLKRASFNGLTTALAEVVVAADAGIRQRAPFAVAVGGQVLIFWHESPSNTWQFNRFDIGTNSFPNPKQILIADAATQPLANFHAARDSTGNVWVAFTNAGNTILTLQVPPAGAPIFRGGIAGGILTNTSPFVLVDNSDSVWYFWNSIPGANNITIQFRQFVPSTATWNLPLVDLPGIVTGTDVAQNVSPAAVVDPDGGIWLFFNSNRSGSGNQDIWFIRRDPLTKTWGEPRQVTGATEADTFPFVLRNTDGVIWLFWNRQLGANGELMQRRIITTI